MPAISTSKIWSNYLVKILHLATSLNGGAGIAARRICQAQIEYGLNASLLGGQVKRGTQLAHGENLFEHSRSQRTHSSLITFVQRNFIQKSQYLTTPISLNLINFHDSRLNEADIVNVHAFYNLLSVQKILHLAQKKKVVVTMHDQRFFTGGCHYSLECDQYQKKCRLCPQVSKCATQIVAAAHESALISHEKFQSIAYVTPSKWLMEMAKESALLKDSRIEIIGNPIPPEYQMNPRIKRREFFCVGFVSENLNNPYKGVPTLVQAINIVAKKLRVVLKLFGTGEVTGLHENVVVEYSRFEKNVDGALAINSCDVIVIPSIQDNSPSVLAESIMCGVPVIASKIGGITEILSKYGLPGFKPGDFEELARLLEFQAVERPEFPLMKIARNDFSYSSSAQKYYALYNQMLNH